MDPLPSHHQAGGGDISDGGEWKQGSARGGRISPPDLPHLPRCPYANRCKDPEYEDQEKENGDEGGSGMEGSPRARQPTPSS